MNKTQKCCCCPNCTVNSGTCCKCIPEYLCVSIGESCNTELRWNKETRRYSGSLSCEGHNYDLMFFFEAVGEDCYFKFRSNALGYPEGYELSWLIGYEVSCATLSVEIGLYGSEVITVHRAEKITPQTCSSCKCLCQCLCITATKVDNGQVTVCSGKICWDDYTQSYHGLLGCNDEYESTQEIAIRIARSPSGTGCAIYFSGLDIDHVIELEDCGSSALTQAFQVDLYGGVTIDVMMRCAVCNEDCSERTDCICPGSDPPLGVPRVLTVSYIRRTGLPGEPPVCVNTGVWTIFGDKQFDGTVKWQSPNATGFAEHGFPWDCCDGNTPECTEHIIGGVSCGLDPFFISVSATSGRSLPRISIHCDPFEAVFSTMDEDGFGEEVVLTE